MAEYNGKKVELNKPYRANDGKKKFYVYVKNDKGNVVRVGFGDPNMEIKRDDPESRKNFRSRHSCDNPGPKWKARYWSCKMWSSKNVSDLTEADDDPCWKDYEQVGMKTKNNKQVPNCVPVSETRDFLRRLTGQKIDLGQPTLSKRSAINESHPEAKRGYRLVFKASDGKWYVEFPKKNGQPIGRSGNEYHGPYKTRHDAVSDTSAYLKLNKLNRVEKGVMFDDSGSSAPPSKTYRPGHKESIAENTQGWDPELLKMAKKYDRAEINMGLKAEQEHNRDPKTDVVGDKNDLLKIVLAHMEEDPQYYTKLSKMEAEAYSPSEYPQTRDPYRQGGFAPYTTVSHNGTVSRLSRAKQTGSVKHKPLGRERPRLKESAEGLNEASQFIKGKGATGQVSVERDNSPVGHGYSIDINGAYGAFWPDDPRDAVVIEMVKVDIGNKVGDEFTGYNLDPKKAYDFVAKRIKQIGISKFIDAVRKAAGTRPDSPLRQSGSIRLRALVDPKLTGRIKFVEYDYNKFEFKL